MTAIERVDAVLAGRKPDRPPFSFWCHFPADQVAGPAALEAHLDQHNTYGTDFIKVMNDNAYPHPQLIQNVKELDALAEFCGDAPAFPRQLELISQLRKATRGQVRLTTTIFNAWATLRQLIQPPKTHKPPNLDAADDDPPSRWILSAWKQNPQSVERA